MVAAEKGAASAANVKVELTEPSKVNGKREEAGVTVVVTQAVADQLEAANAGVIRKGKASRSKAAGGAEGQPQGDSAGEAGDVEPEGGQGASGGDGQG